MKKTRLTKKIIFIMIILVIFSFIWMPILLVLLLLPRTKLRLKITDPIIDFLNTKIDYSPQELKSNQKGE